MLDAAKVKRDLPRLEDYKKNVLEWIDDLREYLLLYDITEPRKVFTWVLAAVEDDVKDVIRVLATRRSGEERYPKFSEIQKAVEEYLEITEGDKWAILRNLEIAEGESLKQFNHRYKKLYHNLSRDYQKLITVKEYKEAISSRIFPCSQVSISKVDTLKEAYEVAELAETTEREIQERNENSQTKRRRNTKNVSMVTQTGNILSTHPIYRSLRREEEGDYSHQVQNYRSYPYKYQGFNKNYASGKSAQAKKESIPKRVTLATNDQEVGGASSRKPSSFKCFRCNQLGHKSSECPYSFKELAEMEEQGLLN